MEIKIHKCIYEGTKLDSFIYKVSYKDIPERMRSFFCLSSNFPPILREVIFGDNFYFRVRNSSLDDRQYVSPILPKRLVGVWVVAPTTTRIFNPTLPEVLQSKGEEVSLEYLEKVVSGVCPRRFDRALTVLKMTGEFESLIIQGGIGSLGILEGVENYLEQL